MSIETDTTVHVLTELGKEAAQKSYFYRFKEIGLSGHRTVIRFKSQHMGRFGVEVVASINKRSGEVTCHLKNTGRYCSRGLSLHDPHFVEKLRDVLNDAGRGIIETEKRRAEKALEEIGRIKRKAKNAGVKK